MQVVHGQSRPLRKHLLAVSLGLAALALSGQAAAGCGYGGPYAAAPVRWDMPPLAAAGFMPAVYRPGEEGFMQVGLLEEIEGIVGTWRFTLTSDGSAYPHEIRYGTVVDFGTHQWHSDGTEIFTSGSRAPSSGDVCMGVWKRIGLNTYKMRHIALAYASSDTVPPASPAVYVGPAIVTETVTLNRAGDRYEGSFTLDQFAQDEVTLLEHIGGKVVATRFKIE